MCTEGDDYMIIDASDEGELEFFPIDTVEFSEDTEWFFEGAWLSFLALVDHTFPLIDIGDPMCSEDEDGDLAIWGRFSCGSSALWLRMMTFAAMHWTWSDGEFH